MFIVSWQPDLLGHFLEILVDHQGKYITSNLDLILNEG